MINLENLNLRNMFAIGGINLNLYGLVFAIAFISFFFVTKRYLVRKKRDPDLAYSATIYAILGTLIGARLFYALFYNLQYFIDSPLKFFYIWEGGLSFHGGLLGMLLAGFLFCKKNKINFLELADIITPPSLLFLAAGRIINFLDGEIYGKLTTLPWCVQFSTIGGCRHPAQLYDALSYLIIITILLKIRQKKLKNGIILASLVFFYSLFRFILDFFRYYEVTYFGLGIGQYLSLISLIISGIYLNNLSRS